MFTVPPLTQVAKAGLIIHSGEAGRTGVKEASGRHGAALLYDWKHARLDVVFRCGVWWWRWGRWSLWS